MRSTATPQLAVALLHPTNTVRAIRSTWWMPTRHADGTSAGSAARTAIHSPTISSRIRNGRRILPTSPGSQPAR
ncbi:MAG: hypothetical protein ACYCZK_04520 [Microbacteriaceae bacterium]